MSKDDGRSPSGRATAVGPVPVSPLRDGIPSAWRNPAPDAAAPAVTSGETFTISATTSGHADDWNAAAARIREAFEADPRFLAIQEANGCRTPRCVPIVCVHPAEGNCPCGEEYLRREPEGSQP